MTQYRNSKETAEAPLGPSRARHAYWVLILGVSLLLTGCPEEPPSEWTTNSEAAREELIRGLEAEAKLYAVEASHHYEQALELDPEFVMAQVKVFARTSNRHPRFEELQEYLQKADTAPLTERERFLVEFFLHQRSKGTKASWPILQGYLEEHPRDPFAIEIKCQFIWDNAEWKKSETCYQELLQADPNWVSAQNRLGYLAMAEGDFAKAEDRFRNYRYIAPDQANPHDSLGELLVLLGRYDEAEVELRKALEIRSDFCASYQNLSTLSLYRGDIAAAYAVATESVDNGCPYGIAERLQCHIESFDLYHKRSWEELASSWESPCSQSGLVPSWMAHLGALKTENLTLAREIEAQTKHHPKRTIKEMNRGPKSPDYLNLVGTRLLYEGKPQEAIKRFAKADDLLDYWGLGSGMYKVYNRILWVEALKRNGAEDRATELLAQVESVNPPLTDSYRSGRFVLP